MQSRAVECHLPLNTGEHALPQPKPDRLVLDLPTLEGCKAELTLVLVIYLDHSPVRRQSPIQAVTIPTESLALDFFIFRPTFYRYATELYYIALKAKWHQKNDFG